MKTRINNTPDFFVDAFKNITLNSEVEELNIFFALVTSNIIEDDDGIIKNGGGITFAIPGEDMLARDSSFVRTAYPFDPRYYSTPVPGQVVKIIVSPSNFYYINSDILGDDEGYFLDDVTTSKLTSLEEKANIEDYQAIDSGEQTPKNTETPAIDVGVYVPPVNKAAPIKEKPGETTLKGFFNNIIKLTYDEEGNGIVSIILDRADENYNADTKGIHSYSNHDVDAEIINPVTNQKNFPVKEIAGGAGIIINDKIRIISKDGSTTIASNANVNIGANGKIYIDGGEGTFIDSPIIQLGVGAEEPLILGDKIVNFLNELLDILTSLTVGTAMGPSTFPLNSARIIALQRTVNSLLSKQNTTL